MEDLTKQQIVLVTLLVSFVTSIATGIVTVSLMDQAPKAVMQTINRVVERTIEKVVPADAQGTSVITKETVVVKEDDFVVQSVDKNSKSIGRIKKNEGTGENTKSYFLGMGVLVSKDGLLVGPLSSGETSVDENGNLIATKFSVVLNDKNYDISLVGSDKENGLSVYKIATTTLASGDGKKGSDGPIVFSPVSLGDSQNLKLGQTVVSVSGKEDNSVSVGIISSLIPKKDTSSAATSTEEKTVSPIVSIKTNIADGEGVLLNLYGDVVGIETGSDYLGKGYFKPSNYISDILAKLTGGSKKESLKK